MAMKIWPRTKKEPHEPPHVNTQTIPAAQEKIWFYCAAIAADSAFSVFVAPRSQKCIWQNGWTVGRTAVRWSNCLSSAEQGRTTLLKYKHRTGRRINLASHAYEPSGRCSGMGSKADMAFKCIHTVFVSTFSFSIFVAIPCADQYHFPIDDCCTAGDICPDYCLGNIFGITGAGANLATFSLFGWCTKNPLIWVEWATRPSVFLSLARLFDTDRDFVHGNCIWREPMASFFYEVFNLVHHCDLHSAAYGVDTEMESSFFFSAGQAKYASLLKTRQNLFINKLLVKCNHISCIAGFVVL